ncbi:MAG: YHYH protein [Actinomycetota bacterium]|nr:YHYH protein [Actinomycetota bacterium]
MASEQTTLPLPQAVLAAWLVNSTGEVAAVISDGAAIPVNVQSTELVEIDGVNHVRVEATGIPDYVHDISSTDEFFLAGRPRADSDFRTGRPLVGVGSRVRFGQDIGYRSTGCDDRPGTGFGFWPPGPTCPTHQAWEALFPVESVEAAASEAQGLGSIGLWVNGVAVFGWGDGHSWLEQDVWHNLAPAAEIYDLDICPGHSAFGTYHHHSHPVCLAEAIGDTGENHSPVYGFAIDGAPIAGPWADTALLARSSWVTRDYDVPGSPTGCETPGTRSCLLVHQLDATAGVVATAWTGPSTSGTAQSLSGNTFVTSSGFYMEDWYYEPRLNDGSPAALDEHNGHVGRIPGFADALYHYHVAREVAADGSIVDVFPYYIGPTFYGVPSATGLGPGAGGPGAGGPGAGGPPDLAAAAATLGVSVAELAQALGPPPPNLPAAAQILGVSLAELEAAVGPP